MLNFDKRQDLVSVLSGYLKPSADVVSLVVGQFFSHYNVSVVMLQIRWP